MYLLKTEEPLCSVTTTRRKLQPQPFHLHFKGGGNEEVRGEASERLTLQHSLASN